MVFGWDRGNFLCRGLYGAVLLILHESSSDSKPVLLKSQRLFCSLCCPANEGAGEWGDVQGNDVCLPKKLLSVMSLAFLGVAEYLLVNGKQGMNSWN